MALPVNTGHLSALGVTRVVTADQQEKAEHHVNRSLDKAIARSPRPVIASSRRTFATPQPGGYIAVTASIDLED